jgi:hypothetical protein
MSARVPASLPAVGKSGSGGGRIVGNLACKAPPGNGEQSIRIPPTGLPTASASRNPLGGKRRGPLSPGPAAFIISLIHKQ